MTLDLEHFVCGGWGGSEIVYSLYTCINVNNYGWSFNTVTGILTFLQVNSATFDNILIFFLQITDQL